MVNLEIKMCKLLHSNEQDLEKLLENGDFSVYVTFEYKPDVSIETTGKATY